MVVDGGGTGRAAGGAANKRLRNVYYFASAQELRPKVRSFFEQSLHIYQFFIYAPMAG